MQYHKEFSHPNLLPLIDGAVHVDRNTSFHVAYLLFPFMAGGSIRDEINRRILTPGRQVR